ncbi:MAG: TrkH family potassium uptake protein [Solirubrobacteraceae bacterium]|nr:TrkH family potassium uptake protein [Solirubrobacteraceae bacterium]
MRRGWGAGPSLNWSVIVPVVSGAVLAVAAGLLLCAVVALVSPDGGGVAFGATGLVAGALSLAGLLVPGRRRGAPLRPRDGFAAVSLAWIVAAAVGAIPFLLVGAFDRPVDAYFESMSGFTTTGATLLSDIEGQADAVLFWRSLSQWIGGVGIVVLVVAIAPATGLATQKVFYAETSGVTADRLTPRIADTAKIIGLVYLALTTLGFLGFWAAGMSAWDALNHVFTSVATGGFSTKNTSMAAFDSLAIELVAIAVMVASGVNFAFYYRALRGRDRLWPAAAEVRAYFLILLGATLAVSASLVISSDGYGIGEGLRQGAFAVSSLMTTTGYTTDDFDDWNDFARVSLVVLMFVGACAGSTAGGMKVIRVMLLAKSASQEVQRQLEPQAVKVLRVRGRVFSEDVRRGVFSFFSLYVTVFAAGTLLIAATGLEPITAATSVAATLNVVGPGLGEVGGLENFSVVPEGGLWLLSAMMLIGRLEVFTVLVLLTPAFWRGSLR